MHWVKTKKTYIGQWKNGLMHGEGKFVWEDIGKSYEGGFENNLRHGLGFIEATNSINGEKTRREVQYQNGDLVNLN